MHLLHVGRGQPLLLLHGLGGSWRSWQPLLPALAARRRLLIPDLPGFGASPALTGPVTIARMADALEALLASRDLLGVGVAGHSAGGELALELARRRLVGPTVAIAPSGFARGWERRWVRAALRGSLTVDRTLVPWLPVLSAHGPSRTLLLGLLSARPWSVRPDHALSELRTVAQSTGLVALLDATDRDPAPAAPAAPGRLRGPITLVWGRRDRLCMPAQAKRALAAFPGATLHWLERCGHYAQWDAPDDVARLVLDATAAPAASAVPREQGLGTAP